MGNVKEMQSRQGKKKKLPEHKEKVWVDGKEVEVFIVGHPLSMWYGYRVSSDTLMFRKA